LPKTISDQRRVLRGIADLLSQQTLSSEDIDELTDLLGVVLNQRDRRTLQRELAVLWKSSAKGAVHRARVKSIEDLWLREHPGGTLPEVWVGEEWLRAWKRWDLAPTLSVLRVRPMS